MAVTINAKGTSEPTFQVGKANTAATIKGGQGAATATGAALTVSSGAGGSTSGASGVLTLQTGTTTSGATGNLNITVSNPGGTAVAGILTLQGGQSRTTQSGNSGGIVLLGGAAGAVASIAGGPIVLTAGAGSTTTTGGVGGAVTIQGGTGGLALAGGAVTIQGGTGGATGAGGTLTLNAGTRNGTGAGSGITLAASAGVTTGAGGGITLTAGAGVSAVGGNITLTPGAGSTVGIVNITAGSLVMGTGALATTATDGFAYISTSAGTPTGVPTTRTGALPVHIDSTNNLLYYYSAGWKTANTAATNLVGGAAGTLVYQSATSTTAFLAAGTSSQVLIGGASAPAWSSTPSGLTSLSAASLFTTGAAGLQITSTAPNVRYTESDQGTDLKDWWMGVDGATFQLQTRTDAFAYIGVPFSVTRAGVASFVGTQTNKYRFSTDATPYYSVFLKARGTAASPTTVVDSDDIGDQQFYGYDGTANRLAASILVEVEGTPATTTVPGRIVFKTTPAGSAQTPVERMRIDSVGNTTITTASNSISTLNIVETGTSGANLKLSGNGGTTPNKFIRAAGGVLQVLNNAYSTVIFELSDSGAVTLVGDTTTNKASPNFLLNATSAGQTATYFTRTASVDRWQFGKSAETESGSNAGSNFFINRYSDAGSFLGGVTIRRSDGFISFGGTGNFESDSAAFALYLDGRSSDGIAAIQFRNFSNVETGRMFVDSSGNWTFANTTATARLGINAGGGISIPAPAATTFNSINITGSTTGASYTTMSNTTGHLRTGVESSVGGTLFTGSSIYASVVGSTTATSLQFATNSTVKATIDSSGNVGIGAVSSGQLLEVIKNQNAGTAIVVRNTDAGASASSILQLTGSAKYVNFTVNPTGSYLAIQGFGGTTIKYEDFDTHNWRNNAGTSNLTLDSTGNLVATGDVSAYSDARMKTNIEVIKGALGRVLEVRGVTFNKTSDNENIRHTGVIAQELQAVLPEAVTEGQDGMLTVAYGNTVGLLIEAIKELNAKVEALSAELAALKG